MEMLLVEGGSPLIGNVWISGSKNAALPILASTILTAGNNSLTNIPDLVDTKFMLHLLEALGANIESKSDENGACRIDTSSVCRKQADYDVVRKMRASVLVFGPLIARFGHARVSLPGGCAIGTRPIDLHLQGLEALGVQITLHEGYVEGSLKGSLRGAEIVFPFPSVGATEHILMTAVLANGTTTIQNAAKEPEIVELSRMLSACGAQIKGAGTSVIEVTGVTSLSPIQHRLSPDRIEAGTFIALAAANRGQMTLHGVELEALQAVIERFLLAGCEFEHEPTQESGFVDLTVKAPERLEAVDLETAPYPGFPTDMQAQLMAAMTVAKGTSHITERIFENRMMHVLELQRLGAHIEVKGNKAIVHGVETLCGAPVMATDLRASASLVIASLRASGCSEIRRLYHLDRGYVRLDEKLRSLGARVTRASA